MLQIGSIDKSQPPPYDLAMTNNLNPTYVEGEVKRVDRLALQEVFMPTAGSLPFTVVAVGYTDMTREKVRIAVQDPYTPPETYRETTLSSGTLVQTLIMEEPEL